MRAGKTVDSCGGVATYHCREAAGYCKQHECDGGPCILLRYKARAHALPLAIVHITDKVWRDIYKTQVVLNYMIMVAITWPFFQIRRPYSPPS
jgi:hypothetical protein